MKLKVATDFSGIGVPEMALEALGVPHENVFACEKDKFARISYLANFKPKVFYEDITQRKHIEVGPVDLYIAGFPCQAFSISGKRKGFDDVRGTLFFDLANFIKTNKPKIFILENVKGLLSHDKPKNSKDGVVVDEIAPSLKSSGGTDIRKRAMIAEVKQFNPSKESGGIQPYQQNRIYDVDGISPSLLSEMSCNTHAVLVPEANKNGYSIVEEGDAIDLKFKDSKTRRGRISKGIAHTVEGQMQQYTIVKKKYGKHQQDAVFDSNGISPTLQSSGDGHIGGASAGYLKYLIGSRIRRLTPLECFRLQDIPDKMYHNCKNAGISDTQLYKQAGNAMTREVLIALIKKVLPNFN